MKLIDCLFHDGVPPTRECLVLDATTYLSYGGTQVVVKEHEQWLTPRLHSVQVIGFLAFNSADFFFSVLAATTTTAPALLNTRWTPPEIAAALMSGPRLHGTILLMYDAGNQDKARAVCRLMEKDGAVATSYQIPDIVKRSLQQRTDRVPPVNTKPTKLRRIKNLTSEDALIVFTSGTTNNAKGVRLSHDAIFCQARVKLKYYNADTRLLASTLPFYHIGGISSILSTWLGGGCLVLSESPAARFEPLGILKSIDLYTVNALVVVPAMLHSLREIVADNSFPAVKFILIGGQSASEAMLVFTRKAFPNAALVQTFACTEAASSLTFLDVTQQKPRVRIGDCVGEAAVDIAIYENNTMTSTPWKIGRISTRGRHVMNGYWGHEPHNRMDWYMSNDLGCFDDRGRLCFCGRTTDTIRTGGETVFSAEVENTMMEHPSIKECAVFGSQDDRFGECVSAAVVFKGEPIGINCVRSFCGDRGLAGFKQPRVLFAVQSIPKNASGKVLKRLLVQHCSKWQKPQRSKL